jgi:hypothetical protein
MSNRIPVDRDLALSFWARLTIVEQFSLAIIDRSFPEPVATRAKRLRLHALSRRDVLHSTNVTSGASSAQPANRYSARALKSVLEPAPDGPRIADELAHEDKARGSKSEPFK